MSRVFISYRRADSAPSATRLYRHLSMRFGKDLVFQDIDDIKLGEDFLDAIRKELKACEVFLIMIGLRWLVDAKGRRRLDNPDDVLRLEISAALNRKKTVVVPVLVDGAVMPSPEDLPQPLRRLSRRNAVSLAEHTWIPNVEAIIERLREIILPRSSDLPLSQASSELDEMQLQYFDLLDAERAADALELAQETQEYLDRVLPLYPQEPYLKMTRGYVFKNEAMALIPLGRLDESEAALAKGESIFRTMLDEQPSDAAALNGLGSIEAVRGNYEKAHQYIDEALKILPDYPAARHDHGMILAYLGKTACGLIELPVKRRRSKKTPRQLE